MKFGCSLEMVNMMVSGPNFIYKQSKSFWVEYFKCVSAVGFKGVELPFNPLNSDPMAFETGRCGIPLSAFAIKAKYGSPEEFLGFLNQIRIEEVASIHMNANDVMLELVAAQRPMDDYFPILEQVGMEAVEHAASLKASGIVISPSPEIGWLNANLGENYEEVFTAKTIEVLKKITAAAKEKGITVALRSEYWSLFRGPKLGELVNEVGCAMCPDLAHLQIAGDPVIKVIEAHKGQIAFMHLTDTKFEDKFENYKKINAEIPVQGAQKVFSDLGEGIVDIPSSLKILKDSGYDGWVICEQRKTLEIYRGLLKMRWYVDDIMSKLN